MTIGLFFELFADYAWRPGDPPDADAEYEPEETLEALEEALRSLGHRTVRIGSARDLLRRIDALDIDAGFNIAEGAHYRSREGYVPMLLELAGIPYIGSDALTLSVSLDKALTKDLARVAEVPTPAYVVVRPGETPGPDAFPAGFPLFVKPRYEGSSKGITIESRVESEAQLLDQVERITTLYLQDALVEKFVGGGGEFTVTIVGNDPPRTLPVLQRAIEQDSEIGLHALEHRGMEDRPWTFGIGATLTPELEDQLNRFGLAMYRKLECRDFARVDFRTDASGNPWFLEMNPLPTFAPDGTFAILAELAGRSYAEFLADVLRPGLQRLGAT